MWCHRLGHFVRGNACGDQAAAHHLGIGEEVQIVRVVGETIEAIRRRALEVLAVCPCSGFVGASRGGLVADARVDVRGHVREVTGSRRQGV